MIVICGIILWLGCGLILSQVLAAVYAPIALVLFVFRAIKGVITAIKLLWYPAWIASFLIFSIYAYLTLFEAFLHWLDAHHSKHNHQRSRQHRENLAEYSRFATGTCFIVQVVWLGALRFRATHQGHNGYVGWVWNFPAHLIVTFVATALVAALLIVFAMLAKRLTESWEGFQKPGGGRDGPKTMIQYKTYGDEEEVS